MAHSERSERGGRQGHWRRRQQRWNGPESFHHDDRGPVFQHYDGLGSPGALRPGPRTLPPVGRADGHLRALDQLSLRHMALDCTSVKNQLLKLKTLLQLEDGAMGPDVEEDTQDNTTTLQLEELMKEVMVLREELRLKDKTIAQLAHQQQHKQEVSRQQQEVSGQQQERGRCVCHQRAPSLRGGDRRTHCHKTTQTPWRGGQGHGGVLPAPLLSSWQSPHPGVPRATMPQRGRQTSGSTAFQPMPQRAAPSGKISKSSPHRGPQ